jgi:hypothetical protein
MAGTETGASSETPSVATVAGRVMAAAGAAAADAAANAAAAAFFFSAANSRFLMMPCSALFSKSWIPPAANELGEGDSGRDASAALRSESADIVRAGLGVVLPSVSARGGG